MAVRVIKRGTIPEEVKHQCVCTNCMSLLEFKISDLKFFHDQREGDYYKLDCPVCSIIKYISADKMRNMVRKDSE